MKKIIFGLFLVLASSNVFAASESYKYNLLSCIDCFNFVAPSIFGAETISPAEVGLIVYDSTYNSFRGYTLGGAWTKLSNEMNFRTVPSSGAIAATIVDDLINVSAVVENRTVTLPPAASLPGKVLKIKKLDPLWNKVTIVGSGAETIGGYANRNLSTQNELIEVVSNGLNWDIVRRNTTTEWVNYIPAWTATTTNPSIGNGSIVGKWRRNGDTVEVFISVYSGTTTTFGNGVYMFSLPTVFNIDSSKISVHGNRTALGAGAAFSATTPYGATAVLNNANPGANQLALMTSTNLVAHNLPATWSGINVSFEMQATYPVVGWEAQ